METKKILIEVDPKIYDRLKELATNEGRSLRKQVVEMVKYQLIYSEDQSIKKASRINRDTNSQKNDSTEETKDQDFDEFYKELTDEDYKEFLNKL